MDEAPRGRTSGFGDGWSSSVISKLRESQEMHLHSGQCYQLTHIRLSDLQPVLPLRLALTPAICWLLECALPSLVENDPRTDRTAAS